MNQHKLDLQPLVIHSKKNKTLHERKLKPTAVKLTQNFIILLFKCKG